jgi:predicted dehydrogenase
LIPAIQASQRGQLVAVASREKSKAKAYAATWEIPHAFEGYQALLESDLIDAIYISLPNHLHAEWSIKAMQAGKHVLCEKPIALSISEVDQMIEASKKYDRVLAEAFMYRHHPQIKIAGQWVQSGKIGDPLLVHSQFNYKLTGSRNVRQIPEYGGGCLWDVGVYPISFAQFIYGRPPKTVNSFQIVGETGVDDLFAGQLCFPNGSLAQINASFLSPFQTIAEVIGTEGRLLLTRPFISLDDGRQMTFFPANGSPVEIPVPEVELYSGEVEDMNNAILDHSPTFVSLEESRNHIRTVLALYESARNNHNVEL